MSLKINSPPTAQGAPWIDWALLRTSLNRIGTGFLSILPVLILILVIIYLIYYVISYYYELRRRYNCFSLNNLFKGKIGRCTENPPEYCKDIDSDLYWGWCLDPDYYGAYPGDVYGPYGIPCNRWIINPKKCPPLRCQGKYPIGLQVDSKNNEVQEYGWCADREINRALRGTYCGPSPEEGVVCRHWIWDEAKCPLTCPINGIPRVEVPKVLPQIIKPQPIVKKECSLICGIKDGKQIPCPPPDCPPSGVCKC